MLKKRPLLTLLMLLAVCVGFIYLQTIEDDTINESQATIEAQRQQLQNYLKKSPFKETLTWDKKKRKLNGLPPNRYYEQMWELTINPSTGKLNDGQLTILREQLKQQRLTQRNPGNASNAWEERGPNNVGGRTRVLLFDPNDLTNNTVYAGGVSGGLWKNTDISNASSAWTRVVNVPGNLSVTSITVDPRNSNIWYVGTGEQYTAGDVVGNGVYVTTDGGTTWNAINIPPAGVGDFSFNASNLFLSGVYYVNDIIAWDNGTSTELFVGVGAHAYGDSSSPANWLGLQSAGLYHSTDGGSNWSRIESSNMEFSFGGNTYYYIPNDLEIGADNKLWMGTISTPGIGGSGGRVYSSTNGSTWTEAAASPLTDSNRVELECSATNANKIYALTEGNTSPVHIYETTNAFGSITALNLPNDADPGIAANDFCRGQAFYDLVIEADPADDDTFYVGGIDLFKTTNGGSSYTQLSHWYGGFGFQYVHADQHAIAFGNGSSTRILYGHDGGISYSGNAGVTIETRNNGYNVTQFVKAGIGPDGVGDTNGIFSAGAQDNGTQAFRDGNTAPGINSSEELSDGDGFYTFVDKDGDYMIATYVYNVIYRFNLPWNGVSRINGGATTLLNSQTTGDFVNPMGYDDDANRLLSNNSSGSSYSIRSINVAANSNGTLTNAALTSKPTAFRASPFASNTWFVGLANGELVKLSSVTNSSATWQSITTPFVGSVSSVRFGETSQDLIVTIHNYGVTSIWYSPDEGSTWVSKEGDLPNLPVRDFLQNPLEPNEAIVATQLGVWETSDFDTSSPTWTQAYNGMSDVSVTAFDYWDISGDDTNNVVIASTYGRGVFTASFTETSVPDTEAPTAPTNLVSADITANSVDLSWDAATDNIAVTEYKVYQDGGLIATVSTTGYRAEGLTPLTNYDFYVIAKDAAGNSSPQSNTENITTLAPDTEAPTTPLNLLASNETSTSVDLSWEASTDNLSVITYDIYQDGSFIVNVNGTTHQVTGLSPNTVYSYKVRAKDPANNESGDSNEVAILTLPADLTYCTSESSNVNDEYISRVQLNTIDNSSGAQFYSDFTNISTALRKGTNYTITITPTWPSTVYDEGYSVWIDYNNDGDFEDIGEQVFTQAPTQTSPVSGSFTIPASATEVATRMRVSLKWNDIPDPCEDFTYGEVEDYTVLIIDSNDLIYTNSAWTPYAPSPSTASDNAFILDGTYTLTGNVEINDLTVFNGASMVIEKAQSLTVNGNLVTEDNVVLESDSDEYASLIANNYVIGNVQYRRYVNTTSATTGNDLISPPVYGESFMDFRTTNSNIVSNAGNTLFLFGPFDKTTDTYQLYSNTETAPMYAGKGYRTASNNASTFTFTGLVSTENTNVDIVNSGPTFPKWNLIGNPYPSYIRLSDFLAANNAQFDSFSSGVYGYDGDATNGWTIWNQAYSDANPNAIIAPGQGFFVSSANNNGAISFTTAMRTNGNADDFILGRNNSNSISYFKLNLSNDNDISHTDFYVSDNASLSLDPGYDATVFGDTATEFSIYSKLIEGNTGLDMAIQAFSEIDISNNVIIPLGINANAGQQLIVSMSDSTLPGDVTVYLEDRDNNTFTLLNNSDFVFNADTDLLGTGRFFLRFEQGTLGIDDSELESLQIISLTNPKRIEIKGELFEASKVTLYDIRGRVILSQNLNEGQIDHSISTASFLNGVYLIEINNAKHKITKKLIVR
ncbi:GEVED domain-containing protein [Winogradskyella tangerina]|uniref:GEVED domain-containing protein n=1 Tax=Winogradskyella tangerina TaxID=2023240 RepID=UPI000DBE4194|nr:GEVED domain-containing protein [Winogradskyella tangerina]